MFRNGISKGKSNRGLNRHLSNLIMYIPWRLISVQVHSKVHLGKSIFRDGRAFETSIDMQLNRLGYYLSIIIYFRKGVFYKQVTPCFKICNIWFYFINHLATQGFSVIQMASQLIGN